MLPELIYGPVTLYVSFNIIDAQNSGPFFPLLLLCACLIKLATVISLAVLSFFLLQHSVSYADLVVNVAAVQVLVTLDDKFVRMGSLTLMDKSYQDTYFDKV